MIRASAGPQTVIIPENLYSAFSRTIQRHCTRLVVWQIYQKHCGDTWITAGTHAEVPSACTCQPKIVTNRPKIFNILDYIHEKESVLVSVRGRVILKIIFQRWALPASCGPALSTMAQCLHFCKIMSNTLCFLEH